ncbi:serine hydrolase [Sphingopyxis sp. JAI128]|uniref:serine hydrolase domain-containing protein n=1 Tax=Sphingopyxis sp. JAI128 TaxID=2723066 RepID=UPI00161DE079|nr:serine hydrolase [Sphingopyxis sp. JAI128]MBB6427877.1 CubicO group peptidase (beta-lactamase class C family) [Sphingopyxis sp. JAI128]
MQDSHHNFGRRQMIGLTLAGLATSPLATVSAKASPGIFGELDALLDTTASSYGTIGHSVAVFRRGTPVYVRHAGLADRDSGSPITERSVYPIFSISKLFLVVELLKLVQRGDLDLTIPIEDIRPDLPETWRGITLAQAIAHVSGLPDYMPDWVAPTEDAAFESLYDKPLRFPRGTRNDYNQTNFLLARAALQQLTGKSLTDLVGTQFRAARMIQTGYHSEYPLGSVSLPNLVTNYQPVPGRAGAPTPFALPSRPTYTFGSAGVFSTLNDMILWSRALLGGALLPPATLHSSWTPFPTSTGAPAWHTHGWEYYSHDDVTIVGHGGGVRLVWRHFFRTTDPGDSATVIYLDNGGRSHFDRHRVAALLADRVMPGAARRAEIEEERLFRGLASNQWDAAVQRLQRVAPADTEAIVNRVGYDALNIWDAEAAVAPLAWNARRFPNSANAHDSLGEAYRSAGRLTAARDSYARALTLAPGDARIRKILTELPQ